MRISDWSSDVCSSDLAEINPLSSAWLAKGVAAKKVGDLASANDAFETALAVDPRNRAAFNALGEVARLQGLTGKSIRFYREALLLDPTDLKALAGQGQSMVEKGDRKSTRLNSSH